MIRIVFAYVPRKVLVVLAACCLQLAATAQQPAEKERADKLYAAALKFMVQPDSLIVYANQLYTLSKNSGYMAGGGTGP